MRGGGARLIVVAAAIALGILVLTKGLEGSGAAAVGVPRHSPTAGSTSPSPTGTATTPSSPTSNGSGPSPHQSGVLIAIYNATSTNGLATATANVLKAKGYVLAGKPGNLPASRDTIIYYKDEQGHADAGHLKSLAIQEAKIQKLPKNLPAEASIPSKAKLVIVLGNDYAATHPISG